MRNKQRKDKHKKFKVHIQLAKASIKAFSLNELIKIYYEKWPQDAKILLDILNANKTALFFNDILLQFKAYINSREAIHPHRYTRKWKFLDAYIVSETDQFKSLNKQLDLFLDKPPILTQVMQTSYQLLMSFGQAGRTLSQYSLKKPGKLLLRILYATGNARLTTAEFTTADGTVTTTLSSDNLGVTSYGKICKDFSFLEMQVMSPTEYDSFSFTGIKRGVTQSKNSEPQNVVSSLEFLKNNLDIRIDDLAAEKEEFTSAYKIFFTSKKENRVSTIKWNFGFLISPQAEFTKKIAEKIGKDGVAKLAVAATFIKNLYPDSETWGFNNDGLVIVKADESPKSLTEFLRHTFNLFEGSWRDTLHGPFSIELSLDNIKDMKAIYQDMLTKALLGSNNYLGISDEIYTTLLNIYIEACAKTIEQVADQIELISQMKKEFWWKAEWNDARPEVDRSLRTFIKEVSSNRGIDFEKHDEPKHIPSSNLPKPNQPPKPYKGLPTKNISSGSKCKEKNIGASKGKVCEFDGAEHFMKETGEKEVGKLLNEYNLMLAKNNMGITVPRTQFVNQHGIYYFSSERVPKFTMASHHWSLSDKQNFKKLFTEVITKKIGREGVARLAVASSFFEDLYNKDNWGYDNNGFVLIDVDKSPKDLEKYFSEASKRLWQTEFPRNRKEEDLGIILSLENVIDMKAIYQNMLAKSPPRLHEEVDMSDEIYITLATVYKEACEKTINYIRTNFSGNDQSTPFDEINKMLAKNILEVAKQHKSSHYAHAFSA